MFCIYFVWVVGGGGKMYGCFVGLLDLLNFFNIAIFFQVILLLDSPHQFDGSYQEWDLNQNEKKSGFWLNLISTSTPIPDRFSDLVEMFGSSKIDIIVGCRVKICL